MHRLTIRAVTDMVADAQLVTAGTAGGPPWTVQQEALLFDSLEAGIPIGQLIAWIPAGGPDGRWYLLDGHRRAQTLRYTRLGTPTLLVRDLTHPDPAYRDVNAMPSADTELPVAALLHQLPFRGAARTATRRTARHSDTAATQLLRARINLVVLHGGTIEHVLDACDRMVPRRITTETLTSLST